MLLIHPWHLVQYEVLCPSDVCAANARRCCALRHSWRYQLIFINQRCIYFRPEWYKKVRHHRYKKVRHRCRVQVHPYHPTSICDHTGAENKRFATPGRVPDTHPGWGRDHEVCVNMVYGYHRGSYREAKTGQCSRRYMQIYAYYACHVHPQNAHAGVVV